MQKNTFVVIGANGFVGSHLVKNLQKIKLATVVCFDRFSKATKFSEYSNTIKIKGDYFSDKDLEKALHYGGTLVHSFSSTSPMTADSNPYADIDLLKRNVQVFERASKLGFGRIVYISSAGVVYGPNVTHTPMTEHDLASPISPYGIAKLASENYLSYFHSKYSIDTQVFRLTNPYGNGQIYKNGQGVIAAFLESIKQGRPLKIIGDGESTRDYIYVDDAAAMIVNAIVKGKGGISYNIGTGKQTSVNQLIANLEKSLKNTLQVEHVEAPKTFLKSSPISIGKYIEEFGRPVFTSLEQGIDRTIKDYFRL